MARVFAGGKVTIPMRVRDFLSIKDGDYVRVSIEVLKKEPEHGGSVTGRKSNSKK